MKTRLYLVTTLLLLCGVTFSQAQPESADVLLNKAYKQAKKEKKNVFVTFHASWCGWCKKLDASINDPACSDYFNKSYVFVHLTVKEVPDKKNLENPGALDLINKYGGVNSGIPFFLIYNNKGVLIADSNIRKEGEGLDKPGSNMGCPASAEEVAAFVEVRKKTSKISDSEITAVTERFKKNKN
jgi:thiol-disulfide isomerase/thioredoxin